MDGLNWYAYAGGNPINFADPTGYGASRVLDAMQGGLTALGFAPGVGAVADLVNAGISAGRGDFVGAGFNLASSLPGLGDAFAAGKIATAAVGVAVAKSASHAVSSTAATAAKVEAAVVKEGATIVGAVDDVGIQFGKSANQVQHAFRHTDALGLDRAVVQSGVQSHLKTVASQITSGKPFNQIIEVGGQRIQYTAFKLPDGTLNVGRIHGAP
jgi:hypothetical protein